MSSPHFDVSVLANHIVIHCRDGHVQQHGNELVELLESLNSSFDSHRIPPLMFMKLHVDDELNSGIVNRVARVAAELKKKGQKFYVVGTNAKNHALLIQSGLDGLLKPASTVEEALNELGVRLPSKVSPPVKIDTQFINPFIQGTRELLQAQSKLTAKLEKPFLRKKDTRLVCEIAALMPIRSAVLTGAVVLGMSREAFKGIVGAWLGIPPGDLQPKHDDGICELLNMVFGYAKGALNQAAEYGIQMALPKRVLKANLLSDPGAGYVTLVVPLSTPLGPVWLQFVTIPGADQLEAYLKRF